MVKQDLYNKSPVRLFDAATEGGLKEGGLGLVTSKKGLGKTSVLVQFGMDTLLKDEQLVHVTFDLHSSNVISWYDGIFAEIAKKSAGNSADRRFVAGYEEGRKRFVGRIVGLGRSYNWTGRDKRYVC